MFGSGAALGALVGGWCFLRVPKKPLSPLTSKAKAGYFYFAVLCIGFGLVSLFYGSSTGDVFVSGRYGGYVGWLSYDGHKRAFVLFGFLAAFWIFMGIGVIKINLLSRTEK